MSEPVEARPEPDNEPAPVLPTPRSVSAPIVGAALSGFVIGVVLTLLATGAVRHGAGRATANATLPPPTTSVGNPLLYQRIGRLVRTELGPSYPPSSGPRVLSISLDPAIPASRGPGIHNIEQFESYRSVTIAFRLNDHPLGAPWRFKAARADVFGLLKALYTSHLPIFAVYLEGQFPVKEGKRRRPEIVLRAYMTHSVADIIPWSKWGRDKEAVLWALLPYKYVDPRFL